MFIHVVPKYYSKATFSNLNVVGSNPRASIHKPVRSVSSFCAEGEGSFCAEGEEATSEGNGAARSAAPLPERLHLSSSQNKRVAHPLGPPAPHISPENNRSTVTTTSLKRIRPKKM